MVDADGVEVNAEEEAAGGGRGFGDEGGTIGAVEVEALHAQAAGLQRTGEGVGHAGFAGDGGLVGVCGVDGGHRDQAGKEFLGVGEVVHERSSGGSIDFGDGAQGFDGNSEGSPSLWCPTSGGGIGRGLEAERWSGEGNVFPGFLWTTL